MKLILVRHPPPLVAPDVCYGRSDLDVAPAQLVAALASLVPSLPRGVAVHSSPLRRCSTLAAPLALALGSAAPLLDSRLAEINFGRWEMRRWADIERTEIDAWAADPVHYRPGAGESVLEVAARVADFLADLRRAQPRAAIAVCHAGTMRLLTALQAGRPVLDAALRAAQTPHAIPYGAMLTLEF